MRLELEVWRCGTLCSLQYCLSRGLARSHTACDRPHPSVAYHPSAYRPRVRPSVRPFVRLSVWSRTVRRIYIISLLFIDLFPAGRLQLSTLGLIASANRNYIFSPPPKPQQEQQLRFWRSWSVLRRTPTATMKLWAMSDGHARTVRHQTTHS